MKKKLIILYTVIIIFAMFLIGVRAETVNDSAQNYQKGALRCPPNKENKNVICEEKFNDAGTEVIEVDVTYNISDDGTDIKVTKMVKKTGILGRYTTQFFVSGENNNPKYLRDAYIDIIQDNSGSQETYIAEMFNAMLYFGEKIVNMDGVGDTYVALDQFASVVVTPWKNTLNSTFHQFCLIGDKSADHRVGRSKNKCLTGRNTDFMKNYVLQRSDIASHSWYNFNADYKVSDGQQPSVWTSHAELALKSALERFQNLEKNKTDGERIVVFFGDGGYYFTKEKNKAYGDGENGDKSWNYYGDFDRIKEYSQKLRDLGVKIYVLRYDGWPGQVRTYGPGVLKDINKTAVDMCVVKNMIGKVDIKSMQDMKNCAKPGVEQLRKEEVSPVFYAEDPGEYYEAFDKIADDIKSQIQEAQINMETVIDDRIGNDFFLSKGNGRKKEFPMGKLTSTGTYSEEFSIDIDEYAKGDEPNGGGWHKTNEFFTLEYISSDGTEKSVTIKDNPEVYWVPFIPDIPGCSFEVTSDTPIRNEDTDINSFYSINCYEGYLENDKYVRGFFVKGNINNLAIGVNKFEIKSGLGFPATIDVSTNVKCEYNFDIDNYNSQYEEITNALKNATGKELASLTLKQQELDGVLTSYSNVSNGKNLEAYEKYFEDQKAYMTLKYVDKDLDYDKVEFVNDGNTESNIRCNTISKASNGIATNQVCYASFSKKMTLKKACLSMRTGDAQNCLSGQAQIDGGNKAYTNQKATAGSVFIEFANAGYGRKLDIKTKDDKACTFDTSKNNITFRPIELTDPFLKNYDRDRGVGQNYLNDKFDFEKIIDEETWNSDKEAEYDYLMSKVNIETIKKDTAEDRKNSYLGRNCDFTDSNEYQCRFTRNTTENGNSNGTRFFTNSKAPEGN